MSAYLARLKSIVAAPVQEKGAGYQLTKLTKAPSVSFVSDRGTPFSRLVPVIEAAAPPANDSSELDMDLIAERAALAADSVPPCYLQAWAKFQARQPLWTSQEQWQRAVDHAGQFLDRWGFLAAEFEWSPDDLFGRDGLAFSLNGEAVRALGPFHAVTVNGGAFERKGSEGDRRHYGQ